MHYKVCLFVAVVSSVLLHELGHATSALAFGDDTATRAGRLTLNPFKVEPFGAFILPGLLVLIGGYPIAFASTPVSPRKMRNPRLHAMLCSLAGPAVNVVLVGVSIVVLRGRANQYLVTGFESWPLLYLFFFALGYANVILAVFNLVPIPPLDGSAVVERYLPRDWWEGWSKVRMYGFPILIVVAFAFPRVFGDVLRPFLNLWGRGWAGARLY
jgi:Zn-dependent protease